MHSCPIPPARQPYHTPTKEVTRITKYMTNQANNTAPTAPRINHIMPLDVPV